MQAELFALGEEKVHAEADAERRRSGLHRSTKGRSGRVREVPHSVAECADAGKDELCRLAHVFGIEVTSTS